MSVLKLSIQIFLTSRWRLKVWLTTMAAPIILQFHRFSSGFVAFNADSVENMHAINNARKSEKVGDLFIDQSLLWYGFIFTDASKQFFFFFFFFYLCILIFNSHNLSVFKNLCKTLWKWKWSQHLSIYFKQIVWTRDGLVQVPYMPNVMFQRFSISDLFTGDTDSDTSKRQSFTRRGL